MTLILFLLLLSVIVILHEGGHLIAAKIFNVYCSEYSIGMGPVLWQTKRKETVYSVRALPIGGSCRFFGEDGKAPGVSRTLRVYPRAPGRPACRSQA